MLCSVLKGRANPTISLIRPRQDSGFKYSKVFKSDRTIVLLVWDVLVGQGVAFWCKEQKWTLAVYLSDSSLEDEGKRM